MNKKVINSCSGGLQGVKEAYVKPSVKARGIEAGNLLNTSIDSIIDSGDLDHGDGGLLEPKDDNLNLWED